MIIKEIKKDLFTVSDDYALAHCISADFALGAGIAKEFDKRFNCRHYLFLRFKASWIPRWDKTQERYRGGSITTYDPKPIFKPKTREYYIRPIFNLVTKRNYWDKPTLTTIKNALFWMKEQCEILYIRKIAMPRLGCGLDRQDWTEVKKLIEEVFEDTNVEIVVCSL